MKNATEPIIGIELPHSRPTQLRIRFAVKTAVRSVPASLVATWGTGPRRLFPERLRAAACSVGFAHATSAPVAVWVGAAVYATAAILVARVTAA